MNSFLKGIQGRRSKRRHSPITQYLKRRRKRNLEKYIN
jgi:hypothetical protein